MTEPKPLWERRHKECAFLVDSENQLSCCAPASGSYCPEHAKIIYRQEPRANLERSLKAYLKR